MGGADRPTSARRALRGALALGVGAASLAATWWALRALDPASFRPPAPRPSGSATPFDDHEPAPFAKLVEVASGLDAPVFAAGVPGLPSRLLVLEQRGAVRVVEHGALLAEPWLDLRERVRSGGEQGLLGLALHPRFADNGRVFVHYDERVGAEPIGRSVVEEWRASADGLHAEPQATRRFFTVEQPYANHKGGMLAFGPDGLLYVGLGDGGSGGDPHGNAQRLDTKLGKLLRLDVDRWPAPPPDPLAGADPLVWDVGLRNPWRFSFDRATGDLYIADVGQNAWEEIDVEPRGSGRANYGWNLREGRHAFRAGSAPAPALVEPVAEYGHDKGCSVTGGYVYRGRRIPALVGTYVFGDFCSNRILSLVWTPGTHTATVREITGAVGATGRVHGLSSFGEDAEGELLVVSLSDGRVLRLEPR